jgi:replication factor C subunit 2/4
MKGSIPWIEKYRPNCLEDIMLDPQISKQISVFIKNNSNTHLIIMGLPGIGKTSTVKCIAKKILGDHIQDGYLELNAAEDRGVKSISMIIPPFCKKVVNFTEPRIILLDEADNLTAKCQYDISSMIKQFGSKTKFIFTCNDSTKIIEDIQSICRIIRFKKLTDEQITIYLEKICQEEKVTYKKTGLSTICYISGGDMRMAINNLQLTAYAYQEISKENVLSVCKLPDPDEIKKIIVLCSEAKLEKAHQALEGIIAHGYYYQDIVTCFVYVLMNNYEIEEGMRLKLMKTVKQTNIIISSGIRSKLQLSSMVCRMVEVFIDK